MNYSSAQQHSCYFEKLRLKHEEFFRPSTQRQMNLVSAMFIKAFLLFALRYHEEK